MFKKSISIILSIFIVAASTICFAADDDIPRPKSVELDPINVVITSQK